MPFSPLSGLALAGWPARCLTSFQTQGLHRVLSSYQCRSKACSWGQGAGGRAAVGAAIWVMGAPFKAPAELKAPPFSPPLSLRSQNPGGKALPLYR